MKPRAAFLDGANQFRAPLRKRSVSSCSAWLASRACTASEPETLIVVQPVLPARWQNTLSRTRTADEEI